MEYLRIRETCFVNFVLARKQPLINGAINPYVFALETSLLSNMQKSLVSLLKKPAKIASLIFHPGFWILKFRIYL